METKLYVLGKFLLMSVRVSSTQYRTQIMKAAKREWWQTSCSSCYSLVGLNLVKYNFRKTCMHSITSGAANPMGSDTLYRYSACM